MNTYLIAVAGGKGLRMGGDIPKQFLSKIIGNIYVKSMPLHSRIR